MVLVEGIIHPDVDNFFHTISASLSFLPELASHYPFDQSGAASPLDEAQDGDMSHSTVLKRT